MWIPKYGKGKALRGEENRPGPFLVAILTEEELWNHFDSTVINIV